MSVGGLSEPVCGLSVSVGGLALTSVISPLSSTLPLLSPLLFVSVDSVPAPPSTLSPPVSHWSTHVSHAAHLTPYWSSAVGQVFVGLVRLRPFHGQLLPRSVSTDTTSVNKRTEN